MLTPTASPGEILPSVPPSVGETFIALACGVSLGLRGGLTLPRGTSPRLPSAPRPASMFIPMELEAAWYMGAKSAVGCISNCRMVRVIVSMELILPV